MVDLRCFSPDMPLQDTAALEVRPVKTLNLATSQITY